MLPTRRYRLFVAGLLTMFASGPLTHGQPPLRSGFELAPKQAGPGHEDHAGCTILGVDEDGRSLQEGTLWPGGVVPYAFAANVNATNQSRAIAAMGEIESVSTVRFIARTNETNYVRFVSSTSNSSFIGMIGGGQDINMVSWSYRFIIVHELLHALGVWHEQQRPDRDAFIQINWGNIEPGFSHNFSIRGSALAIGAYDFDSVMHYGSCGFSVCSGCNASCYTITVLPPYADKQSSIGQRTRLSDGDILFLTSIYGGGEVYNQTDDVYSLSIEEAIGLASNGDALVSTSRRFTMEPLIDFDGKAIALESYTEITRNAGSTTLLSNNAALRAAPGSAMHLAGNVSVPPIGTAVVTADAITIAATGQVTLGPSALASFNASSLDLLGDLILDDSATVLVSAGAMFQAHPAGVLTLGVDAEFDVSGDAALLGATAVRPGSLLAVSGQLAQGVDGVITVEAPVAGRSTQPALMTVDTGQFGGALTLDAGASLDLTAASLDLNSSGTWVLEDGSVMSVSAVLGSTLAGEVNLLTIASLQFDDDLIIGDPGVGRTFETVQAGSTVSSPSAVAVGDYDGDGDADIVVASLTLGDIFVLDSSGGDAPTYTKRTVSLNVSGAVGVSLADVDGDGDQDVLSAGNIAGRFYWHENLGGAPPVFADRTVTTLADGAYAIEAADLDDDGDIDLVGASANNSTVAWFENNGAQPPAFVRHVVSASATGATSVAIADIDADGDLDIVASLRDAGAVMWYANDGAADPTFATRTVSGAVDGAFDVAVADMDGDGDLDVVSAAQFLNSVLWHENDGGVDPTFQDRVVATELSGVISIAVADIDGDSAPDVAAAMQSGGRMDVFRSSGGAAPAFTAIFGDGGVTAASSVAMGELNGDGEVDLVAASRTGNKVNLYTQRIPGVRVGASASLSSQSMLLQGPVQLGSGAMLHADALTIAPSGSVSSEAGASVVVSGMLDVQSEPGVIGLRSATLVMTGAGGSFEVFSEDVGADIGPTGLDDPGRGAVGAVRVEAGRTVDLIDAVANSGGARSPDALYVSALTIEPGAILQTNGLRVYYETLTLSGAVDAPANLIELGACPADLNGDGSVDGADLAALLSAWGSESSLANLAGAAVVDGEDLAALLASWGSCAG